MNRGAFFSKARQLGWLALYDLRQQVREKGNLLLMFVALALALLALAQGHSFSRQVQRQAAGAQAQQTQALAQARSDAARYFTQSDAPRYAGLRWWRVSFDLRGYAFREHLEFAIKPALPGAALAIGQGDLLPSVVRVKAESMDSARQAADIVHPARLASGGFDLLFFVVCLWPLVLLALTQSALTRDRELRRLPSLALLGVGAAQALLVQTLARTLLAGVLLCAVVGVAALAGGVLPRSGAGLLAWFQWSCWVMAYSLFWAGVAALVCARASNRMTAAFAGFGAWVCMVVLLPALWAAVVSRVAPLPSRESHVVAMRDAVDQVQANRAGVMARFYDQHPEWRPATAMDKLSNSVTQLVRAEELERSLAGVDKQFEQARERQARLLSRINLLSPVTLTHEAFSALSGNDAQRHAAFVAQVRQHQLALRAFFQARIQQAALGDEKNPCPATCLGGYGFTDFDAVPRFQPVASLRASDGAKGWGLWVLLGWGVVLLLVAGRLTPPVMSPARALRPLPRGAVGT